MTFSDLGALGEFFGFFAVLATLIYLAIQTRQSKELAVAETTRNIISEFQQIWGTLVEDPERTRIIRIAVNDWEALSKNEQLIAHSFFVNLVAHLSSALQDEGMLPELKPFERAWEDNIIGLLTTPGERQWWETCNYLFLPIARDRMVQRLSEGDGLPPPWNELMPWWTLDSQEIGPDQRS